MAIALYSNLQYFHQYFRGEEACRRNESLRYMCGVPRHRHCRFKKVAGTDRFCCRIMPLGGNDFGGLDRATSLYNSEFLNDMPIITRSRPIDVW